MSRVHVTTEINAPVDRVWKTVMNPDCLKDWVTIHRSVEAVSARPLHEGSTMDQVLQLRGASFHVHWTLVEVNQPIHAAWAGVGPAHSHARIRYELTADGDGATQFEYINEFIPPGGRLGSVAGRVIDGAASEREAEKSLRRLKGLLEHLTHRRPAGRIVE
jgi:uncharacterized protein YndB with AHSA1/START domain